jgi:hypothetical protein
MASKAAKAGSAEAAMETSAKTAVAAASESQGICRNCRGTE